MTAEGNLLILCRRELHYRMHNLKMTTFEKYAPRGTENGRRHSETELNLSDDSSGTAHMRGEQQLIQAG